MAAAASRIGRYLPLAVLGQRRLIDTVRACADDAPGGASQSSVVLKVLRKASCGPDIIARFLETVRMLRWTSLPGLPNLVDIGEDPGPIFAALEFNEGVNLAQLRAQSVEPAGVMDVRLVGLLGRKLAERLGPLHAQADGPRVHGALSPGNVLVRPDGEMLLLDCALTEALRTLPAWPSDNWQYASPEQLEGQPAEQASDFYALGGLLYFLCFGKPPFEAESPEALVDRMKLGPPELGGIHPAVGACIAKMLAYESANRPKSAGEVMRQLSVALMSARAGMARATAAMVVPKPAGVPPAAVPDEPIEPSEVPVPTEDDVELPVPAKTSAFADSRGAIAADDPDVGVVYDEDDEEDEIEVGPDGKVKRRRRRKIRLLEWTKSAFARKLFRYAWAPIAIALIVGGVEGYFFLQSWRAARADSRRKDEARTAEIARLEAVKPKLEKKPETPAGHLVLKISPPGAVVWIDGVESGTAPNTMLTTPGAHKLVVTAPGYRMLRDVVDTTNGAVFERHMAPAIFPLTGAVGINVACTTEGKYPVLVDGREIGALCPISGVRLDPGKHMVGIFVIPQNRIWTLDRDIVAEKPHRVQFSY
jgi:hypothetical protein